ncbi:MAG TPA: glycosyltransferase family A protein, partial [Mycoplana sp.]|nr:glycosyltransferase family A protein [Mycoplana sp.]
MTEQHSTEPGDALAPSERAQRTLPLAQDSGPALPLAASQDAGGTRPQYRTLSAQDVAARRWPDGAGPALQKADPVAEGLREQLAHRLGTELIAATRSVAALLGLPFALRRAFRQHGQAMKALDISRRTSNQPAENGAVDPAAGHGRRATEQFHGQLAYRLGAELLAVRSPLSVLGLPFALHRAYRGFKSEKGGKASRRGPGIGVVARLETKLWGGYASYAHADLEACLDDEAANERLRSAAAHALARWHYAEGAFAKAAELMACSVALSCGNLQEQRLCQLLCLVRAERPHEAAAILEETPVAAGRAIDFAIVGAEILRRRALADGLPVAECDRLYLEALNEAMVPSGMSPIELADPGRPLSIWNIVSRPAARKAVQDAKVSVIVPAYNAEKTLAMALDSLAAQTWRNLEIIVVDDASTDATCDLVTGYAARDPRVRLVRRAANGGAYPARNDGVEVATGDLVTVCDSDDWSHPEKIERQMQALAERPDCVAVLSHWLRVHDDLGLAGPWIPKLSVLDLNLSSLLVRREVFDRLRGWDEVRVTGDAEFRARIEAVYGAKAICKVRHDNVLSFSLVRDDSLTRSAATHLRSLRFGVRGLYRDSYRNWHNSLRHGGDPHLPRSNGRFPVPLGNRRAGSDVRTFDIVFVSDFALKGGAFVSTLNYIEAARAAGLSVGVFHWRRYDLDALQGLNPRIRHLAQD